MGSQEDIYFRERYTAVLNIFKSVVRDYSNFSELDKRTIKDYLYKPICKLVVDFVNEYGKQYSHSNALFRFLVGNEGFYKITLFDKPLKKKHLLIQEFIDLPPAKSVSAKLLLTKYCNYIHLAFSNGWKMRIRLHTASSKIGDSISLKFDTHIEGTVVPETKIYL